jgi:glycosyltransferase involved in cell wall biosynthesis
VSAWRERERDMIRLGADVRLVAATVWSEGGSAVSLEPGVDRFVTGLRTIGRHPNLFAYDPLGLWRALRANEFDVLDIHEEPVSVAAAEAQLVAWVARRRVPFALYSAQNISKRYPIPFRWLERVALRRAAAVHTCNKASGCIVRAKGFQGFVANLGLGIDVSRFSPARAEGTGAPRAVRVGYVGRLERHKGVYELVDAVAAIPGCSLEIVGDGPERSGLVARVSAASASDRIVFVGYVDQAALPHWYNRFDVLAVPSLETPGWVEQFGRVAVEAMACGVPVVASRSGALPEVVAETGILVRPGDVPALTEALVRLAEDPAERQRLGGLARARAQHYSWPTIARRQLDLYEEMLVGGP